MDVQKEMDDFNSGGFACFDVGSRLSCFAAEYGSNDDPLVSLSYITDVLAPETLKKVDEEIDKKMQNLNLSLLIDGKLF
jgi:hypothetical protein